MMYQTRYVVGSFLARVLIGALAATAWLILSTGAPGSVLDEVCAHTPSARAVSRAVSTCWERASGTPTSRWCGGAGLNLRQSELRGMPLLSLQSGCEAGADV
jgi:hypothetical protein